MAMERPHPRIIGQEINHHITRLSRTGIPPIDDVCVSSLRVLGTRDDSVPFPHPLGDDPETMAVKVHGMHNRDSVAQDEADRGAITKIVDVPLRVVGVGRVA